ncbi:MAG TPA: hypothetical protein VGD64_06630 [Acidisarcina sp.]
MRITFAVELLIHTAVLGTVITAVRNRIPALRRANYNDDGTLTIGSSESAIVPEIRWTEIAAIIAEFALYLTIWAWIFKLI